ncbi:hypothetical protein BCD91_002707 [Clostridium beijerinckii]|nr:hypothetical protein [Clostridium beijerinckii]
MDNLWQISNAIENQKILKIGYCKPGIDKKMQEEIGKIYR